jgi:SAM-dependent methyltransferase
MTTDCFRRGDCRLCGGTDLTLVLGLTQTPPANAFVREDALEQPQKAYPLDVFFCESCGHVQLCDVVDPRILFENYIYVSGTSPIFVRHFDEYAESLVSRFAPSMGGKWAMDIGSNDGTLLAALKQRGLGVLGVDPARDIAADATARGIETLPTFFTRALAEELIAERGPATLITANNVFAHADGLDDITAGIAGLLAPDGVFAFEVSYLVDVFEKTLFDTIYHEHLAYHSVKPLKAFFERHGLVFFSAARVDSHGGSLRGFVGRADGPWKPDGSVEALIELEAGLGLDQSETLVAFAEKIDRIGRELGEVLDGFKHAGKSVAGFGAPAKATTLMYHFGIDESQIDFIVDDSPLKQGMYSPGKHIPVLPSDALYERKPDAVVVLAWNFAEPIMKNHAAYREAGGTFIVPLPEVRTF